MEEWTKDEWRSVIRVVLPDGDYRTAELAVAEMRGTRRIADGLRKAIRDGWEPPGDGGPAEGE